MFLTALLRRWCRLTSRSDPREPSASGKPVQQPPEPAVCRVE